VDEFAAHLVTVVIRVSKQVPRKAAIAAAG
jgi:hypothetical protein